MLTERVLEELTRNTGLCEHLVTIAWPSLSTESRLQVISAIEGGGVSKVTPNWLAKLALDDPAPVVRYWAARHTYFRHKGLDDYVERFKARAAASEEENATYAKLAKSLAASEDEKVLFAKAAADPCELVRFCAEEGDEYNFKTLNKASQIGRLAFIRHLDLPNLESFITWLEEAIAAGVPDSELGDCAHEFFMHPRVLKDLKRETDDFVDGLDAYQCGEGMRKGWALTKVAGPRVRNILCYALPTSYGLRTMAVDELAQVPDDVLEAFFYHDATSEIDGVLKLMHDQPQRFSPKIIEKFKHWAEDFDAPNLSPEKLREERTRQAVERQAETLETVLDLKHRLADLLEYVQQGITTLTNETQTGFKALLTALFWGAGGIAILLLILRWRG